MMTEKNKEKITEKISKNRVKGYLHRKADTLVNGSGEEVLLTGWGLGNWLLQEGYMWKSGSVRFDRPKRIENAVEELTGKAYAQAFWQRFRDCYITREDILYMAKLGYNSVRLPFNWRLFLEEEPGLIWKEEGFRRLDDCVAWCEEAGLYLFFDMHGAPGGQTGSNIDDSYDNVPRLFIDQHNKEKALAIWEKIAERYHDRNIVGGYDLLNEPIAPESATGRNFDYLIPELKTFYEDCIAVIRKHDKNHLISIEGEHWATGLEIFDRIYDENMVMHIHRYAELPQKECLDCYLKKAEELHLPIWLGETGENLNEWYSALYPLAMNLNIGINLWPWKKMDCTNSPCSINVPEGWDLVLAYLEGEAHPGYEKAQQIFDQYLHNTLLENCTIHDEVTDAVFRRDTFSLRATDFDEAIGESPAYHCVNPVPGKPGQEILSENAGNHVKNNYRPGTGFPLVELGSEKDSRFAFDCKWDRFALPLQEGEWVNYWHMNLAQGAALYIKYHCDEVTTVEFLQGERAIHTLTLDPCEGYVESQALQLQQEEEGILTIKVIRGRILLEKLQFVK